MSTTETKTDSKMVNFSVRGDFLTNLARKKWIEDTPNNAVEFLITSLPGMSQELAIEILTGQKKLEGVNELYVEDDVVTELDGIPISIQARWDRLIPKFLDILAQMISIKNRMLVLANTMTAKGASYRVGLRYNDDNEDMSFSLKADKEKYIHLAKQIKPIQDDIAFVAKLLGKKMSDIPYEQIPDYPSVVNTQQDRPEQIYTMESLLSDETDVKVENEEFHWIHQNNQVMLDSYLTANREIEEKLKEPIKPNPISDLNSAGWLAPNGDWYGLNGESANMLHNIIADALVEAGILDKEEVKDNPDGWMGLNGWVKIRDRQVLFDGYMKQQFGLGRNIPLTSAQKEKLEEYGQLMGGWLNFGVKNVCISAPSISWLSDDQLEDAFSL